MYRNFAFNCDLTRVQKCAVQTLARDITGSRSGLSCFIIAIELLQACYYAVMKGVFSFSFQLANLGEIPHVISPWHRFWEKEFSKVLEYMWGLFPWKRQRKYIFVQLNLSLLLKYIIVTDDLNIVSVTVGFLEEDSGSVCDLRWQDLAQCDLWKQ